MKKIVLFGGSAFLTVFLGSCAGMKLVDPNDDLHKDAGTKMLDLSEGTPRLASTYTCRLKSMGESFTALAKTEEGARDEVIVRCRERTTISFCDSGKVECVKN